MGSTTFSASARRPGFAAWAAALSLSLLLQACGGGDSGAAGADPGNAGGGGGAGGGMPAAGFSVSIAQASVTVGQGQAALIEVTVQRDAGFNEPVNVALNQPPAGITADPLVLSASQTRGLLSIHVSADAALGSVLGLDVAGTAAGVSHAASTRLTVSAPQADAQALIAAALKAGTVDYGTTLLYRAYALLGDKRLPDLYSGAGSAEEDNLLFDEIRLRLAGLPVTTQDALRPFMVRPADPRSVWNTPATGSAGQAKALRETRQAASPASCATSTLSGSWISRRSASHPVRVWAQCTGVASTDAESVTLIDKTLIVLDKVYGPMTAVMGEPLRDLEGDDNAIDLYILDAAHYVNRQTANFKPHGLATTYWDYPETARGKGTSAFVTLQRSALFTSRFHNTVIHEFFHVLQKAHNSEFAANPVAGAPNAYELHWFAEASAAWASAYFDRTVGGWDDGRGAYGDVYFRFKKIFQTSHDALNAVGGSVSATQHDYSAFIWPYFVEKETGGAAFMTSMWAGLNNVSSFEEADQAIDRVYPFATNFKRFALRNLNAQLLPGDPLPADKRHASLDSTQFIDDRVEPPYELGTLSANSEFSRDLELKNLSARYVRLNVSQEGTATRKVTVDATALQPAGGLDLQALVRTSDGWLSQPIDIASGKAVFCFDKGPATATVLGSFQEILLIVSNHALTKAGDMTGALKVQPKSEPCATVWEGTVSQTLRGDLGQGATFTLTTVANVTFEFDPVTQAMGGEVPFRLRSGSFTYDMLVDQPNRNPACRSIGRGAGALPLLAYQPLVPSGTAAGLSIFPETLQYGGGGASVVTVTTTSNCNDRHVDEVTVDPNATMVWWNEPGPGQIAADGLSIRRAYTAANSVVYDIRLDKKIGAE